MVSNEVTLRTIESTLKPLGLTRLTRHSDPTDPPVTEVVIWDGEYAQPVSQGALVLVVALGAAIDAVALLRDEALRAPAAAIVVKAGSEHADLIASLLRGGAPTVLSVRPATNWGHLYTYVEKLLGVEDTPLPSPLSNDSDGLNSIADAVASLCGGSVLIEDAHRRVVAYSGIAEGIDEARRRAILTRQTATDLDELFRRDSLLRRLSNGAVVTLEPGRYPGVTERRVVAAIASGRILATLWLQNGREDPQIDDALRAGASSVALYFARRRVATEVKDLALDEATAAILFGDSPFEGVQQHVGLPPVGDYTVVMLKPTGDTAASRAIACGRIISLLEVYRGAYRIPGASCWRSNAVYALLGSKNSRSPGGQDYVRSFLSTVHTQALKHSTVLAAVGRTVDHLGAVPRSRRDAELTIRALEERDDGDIATIDDLFSDVFVLELKERLRESSELVRGPLRRLAEVDAREKTEYLRSLEVYFRHNCNARATARALHVHANTLHYRINKICQLTGIDLEDSQQRFVTEFHVRIMMENISPALGHGTN